MATIIAAGFETYVEAQDALAQRRQSQAALVAHRRDFAQIGLGLVHMMLGVRTGLVVGVAMGSHRPGS